MLYLLTHLSISIQIFHQADFVSLVCHAWHKCLKSLNDFFTPKGEGGVGTLGGVT